MQIPKLNITKLKKLKLPRKTILIIAGISMVLIAAVISMVKTKSAKPIPSAKINPLSVQLNSIARQVTQIRQELGNNQLQINLDSVNAELAKVSHQAEQLAAKSDDLITNEIKSSSKQLAAKLNKITNELHKLQQERKIVTYLKPANLPFKIISIDNIQQQNIVSVNYNHTDFPLEIGDYLTGWKLVKADFASQRAEFINHKNQHVVIDLNRIEQPKGRA